MSQKNKLLVFFLFFLAVGVAGVSFLYFGDIAVLDPQGMIALKERDLLLTATWLMLLIVIPVFILTVWVAFKYHSGNTKAKFRPDWDKSHLAETIWLGVPCIIGIVLSVLIWNSCHELDPFRPIASTSKPIKIQAVALQWKWLFIYPDHGIATVNFIQFPEQVPVDFEITADAPMNSFWIPELGGQIYAMPGMKAQLHLIADTLG
ncbi:MAG TPA: cytochrome ubiquinol oxidase subunit II, partial [Rhabdochlamydiaceae bacterium]